MAFDQNKEKDYISRRQKELREELAHLEQMESDEQYFRGRSAERVAHRQKQHAEMKNKSFATNCVWGMYGKKDIDQFKSMTLPVFSTTAGAPYDSLTDGALLLSYQTINDPNKIYSRIDNTTIDHLAMKLAVMEGHSIPEQTQALCVSSGMAAVFMSSMAFLEGGDEFVSSNRIYGGTEQLFSKTYPKMGWKVHWVNQPWDLEAWKKAITPKTRFLYVETPSNPTLYVADLPALADLAHENGIPLIVDATIASPALLRPLEHGADIVLHSLTKIMASSGRSIGGVVIAKEKIVTSRDDLIFNFTNQLKGGHFRNLGPCLHPPSAASIWDNINTLELRQRAVSARALKIAQFLETHAKIEKVNYPGLESHPQHQVAKKLMRFPDGSNGYSYLLSFNIKGDLETTKRFASLFDFGVQVTDLGHDFTVWVHNASTTHGQMTAEMRSLAGIEDNLIRYSVGLEGAEDAISALGRALDKL